MYTRELTPEGRASKGFEDLLSNMDGSPRRELHAAKIGFTMEMCLSKPPTIACDISRADRRDELIHRDASNLTPLAFNFRKLKPSARTYRLLKTKDGTVVTAMVLDSVKCTDSLIVRDMDADQLWYVYEGSGRCYTDLGSFVFSAGDFVYIPRHMLSYFHAHWETKMIGIQSEKGLLPASRSAYDNVDVPFNTFAMRLPEPNTECGEISKKRVVFVKRDGEWNCVKYEYTPFLCVAWKGAPYSFAIHQSKLNFAYTKSIHADPSNFAVFASPDASAVVSVLGPRFVHSLPYNHLNAWDEFLFYAKAYDAREGTSGGVGNGGTATLHPQGIWHGPQMAAFEKWKRPDSSEDLPFVDDLAIMFETKGALQLLSDADTGDLLIPGYEKSWLESWEEYKQNQTK